MLFFTFAHPLEPTPAKLPAHKTDKYAIPGDHPRYSFPLTEKPSVTLDPAFHSCAVGVCSPLPNVVVRFPYLLSFHRNYSASPPPLKCPLWTVNFPYVELSTSPHLAPRPIPHRPLSYSLQTGEFFCAQNPHLLPEKVHSVVCCKTSWPFTGELPLPLTFLTA